MGEKVIFVAGVYGVGKSSLCEKLSQSLGIPAFSASDLISAENGEQYGANKVVTDKNANQDILIDAINRLLKTNCPIILTGHFCFFGQKNMVEILPKSAFAKMNITKIVLLEAETEQVLDNLRKRDGKEYSLEEIRALQTAEKTEAIKISEFLQVPLIKYWITYNDSDVNDIVDCLKG